MMEGISFDMHWNTWVTGMRAMHAVTLSENGAYQS